MTQPEMDNPQPEPEAEPDAEAEPEAEPEPAPEDVEVAQTDVSESGADPDGFFDDIEESPGGDNPFEDGDPFADEEESQETDSTESDGELAENINAGMARAAVIGLDDEWETDHGTQQKDDLRAEFEETFEAFRLGHYGEIVAKEYVLTDDNINPAWGLLGASLVCAAMVIYRRPDGERLIEAAPGSASLPDIDQLI